MRYASARPSSGMYRSDRDDWILAMVAAGLGFAFMPQYSITAGTPRLQDARRGDRANRQSGLSAISGFSGKRALASPPQAVDHQRRANQRRDDVGVGSAEVTIVLNKFFEAPGRGSLCGDQLGWVDIGIGPCGKVIVLLFHWWGAI